MDRQRWQDLDTRLVKSGQLAFDFEFCLAFEYKQQLAEISMAVGFDFPLVFAAALGDGFAMQQVRRRPVQTVTVEFEYRNRRKGRLVHNVSPGLSGTGDNRPIGEMYRFGLSALP